MKKYKRLIILLLLLALFGVVGSAAAHPLGNFTVSRYSALTLEQEAIHILYIVDMAEIPTFQEQQQIDSDGDGEINAAEEEAYLNTQIPALVGNLQLAINNQPLSLQLQDHTLSFPPGQGDLPTMRLELSLLAPLPAATGVVWEAQYSDNSYPDRLGWREVVVQAADGVSLQGSSVPAADISDQLRNYPDDLLQAPLQISQAGFRFAPLGISSTNEADSSVGTTSTAAAHSNQQNRFGEDEFANLLSRTLDTPGAVAAVLVLAFMLGAAHALTPGHGKTIVGAYLVGSRGTAKHALFLGLTTTITHTAGVFALGILVLFASRYILPERLYPWLGVLSGLLVVVIGASILRGHLSHWWRNRGVTTAADNEGVHYHFGIAHTHQPGEKGHSHSDHSHSGHASHPQTMNMRNLLALGISGGLLPCPSALILLLSAIALRQVGIGLVLIVVFSLGLASVLTGIGLVLVYAGRFLERLPLRHNAITSRLLPAASAAFITIAGVVITVRALIETGTI